MFDFQRPGLEKDLNLLQGTSDRIIEGYDFINSIRQQLLAEGTHPWHAPDAVMVQMDMAAMALACELTSQRLQEAGMAPSTEEAGRQLPNDILHYAHDLTEHASGLMHQAKT